jgi:hypothetical protein
MATTEFAALLQKIHDVAETITTCISPGERSEVVHKPFRLAHPSRGVDRLQFTFPDSTNLTSELTKLGLPSQLVDTMMAAYSCKSEELKTSSEAIVRTSCAKLAELPQVDGMMPLEQLQKQLFELYHQKFLSTLAAWARETIELASSRLIVASSSSSSQCVDISSGRSRVKRKGQFKTVSVLKECLVMQ